MSVDTALLKMAVRMEGIEPVRKAFKVAGDVGFANTEKELYKDIAADIADKAKSRGSDLGSVFAKAAPSMRAGSNGKTAYVSLGGKAYPYALGAEFGSVRYKQFQPWRGTGDDAGYFLYPTIRADKDNIEKMAKEAVDKLLTIFST
jgi:hypothetical protein